MKVACICPTYGKPILLQNALAQFNAQTYPADDRALFILDDAGQFPRSAKPGQTIDRWSWSAYSRQWQLSNVLLWSTPSRFPTIVAKYNFLAQMALDWGADAFAIIDDDDIYLPNYIEDHVRNLQLSSWSHPDAIYSLYTGHLEVEGAHGRFHGALAFTRQAGLSVGFWGDNTNGRCGHDQEIMGRLGKIANPSRSTELTYVYRWGSTHADHCSGRVKSWDDTTWYANTPISQPGTFDTLEPKMDDETIYVYSEIAARSAAKSGYIPSPVT